MEIVSRDAAIAAGLKRYFTGKPCKHGHISERRVHNHECYECSLLSNRERCRKIPREKRQETNRLHYTRHAEKLRERSRKWREDNPGANTEYIREYKANHRERLNALEVERRANDPAALIKYRLRHRLGDMIRRRQTHKAASTMELVGCPIDQLLAHIEGQFVDGMNWENRHLWDIDHIRPCASFDLTNPEQQRECFHWSNLRPMWKEHHRQKTRRDWAAIKAFRNRAA